MSGKIIGVIPLRGSDREAQTTPESLLCGKPALAYTIDAAKQAACLDRIIVSTDSPAVADLARRCGAEAPFLRPAALAAETASLTAVLQHCLAWLEREEGYQAEIVVLLESTHPIRPAGLIDSVVETLQAEGLDTVFTAREERHRFWQTVDDTLAPVQTEGDRTRQQGQPIYKELAGMATAIQASVIRRGERMGQRVGLVPVRGPATAVDLHDEDGWWLARRLLSGEEDAREALRGDR